MYQRLATLVRKQLNSLVDQYDDRLHTVPGYANLPEQARRDLEQRVLQIMVECLEANDATPLIEYIHQRAEQILAHGFQPEWFLQAVIIPQDIVTPLTKTVAESNFVWRALDQAQTTVWEIVAHERRRLEQEAKESLARRDIQVRTSIAVAQEIAAATDLNELFQRVVTLIKERFNYYHAQLFRYEPAQEAVVLITGYGEIGAKMLAAGHQLPMGRGVVGTAATTGQSILAADVTTAEDWQPNPDLPETKGELAVPIKLRQEVLGILDVQSDQTGALTDDDRLLLEGLCGQIATAMASKLAEQAIKEEQQRTRTILETVTVPVIISRLSDSKVLYANQALADFRHMVLDELIGSRTTDYFVRSEDREKLVETLRRQGYAYDFETQLRGSGGVVSWVLLAARIINFQNETCVLSSYTDITERKQAEETLRQNEAQLSEALKIAKLGYWEYDVEKDLFFFNDQFYSIFHTTAEREGGYQLSSAQYAQRFVHPDDQMMVGTEIGKALSSTDRHYTRQLEHRILYADGGIGHISVNVNIDRDEQGRILHYYGANQDITERKRAEQKMEETLRETERLYAAVSHESWQAYRRTGSAGEGYVFDQTLIQTAANVWEPEIALALEQQALVTSRSGQRAVAVTPLTIRGEAIGALGVYDDPAHPLSKDDLDLIETVSEQVALALESARLFDQTQMALTDTRTLFRFSDLVSRETGIKPVYDSVAQLLVEEAGFAGTWIAQVDTQAQVLRGVAGAGLGMGPDRNFDVVPYQHLQTPATIAARDRAMIVVNDPLHDERLSGLPDQMKAVVGKSIAVPIIIDGEIESIIAATRPMGGLDIGERDQRLLQTAAAQVAIAIQRARLFERTQRDAEREYTINRVTSRIRNARSVDEVLTIAAQELRMATRASRSVVEILPATNQAPRSGNGEGGKA